MNAKAESQTSKADVAMLAGAGAVLAVAIVGFYIFSEYSLLLRVLSLLAAVGVSVAIAMQTAVGRAAWGFIQDARTEVRKVVWPTRAETVQTTISVMVMVVIAAVFLWLLDMILVWAVKLLTGQGG
jgi:preprotein translocase subunit SecE